MENTNKIEIIGTVNSKPTFDHESFGEKFFSCIVNTKRLSGTYDCLPVLIPERLIDVNTIEVNQKVKIIGQLRSFNLNENKIKLILTVFVKDIEFVDDSLHDKNVIELNGYICKEPVYRTTLRGRQITDVLLAVNRNYKKSDYIPSICWGRNAIFAKDLTVGSNIIVSGRFQSREYNKKISENEIVVKTAYEVSVSKITEVTNNQ